MEQNEDHQIIGKIEFMQYDGRFQKPCIRQTLHRREITNKNRVSPQHLAHCGKGALTILEWFNGAALHIDKFMQLKILISKEDLDITKQRLIFINQNSTSV